jgi:predicted ester cyclase
MLGAVTTPLDPAACVRAVIDCDNARDARGYRALLHSDYVASVHGRVTATDADTETAALQSWWAAASDGHLVIDDLFAAGELVTVRYRILGTNDGPLAGRPATGKRFELHGCTILQAQGGRVKRVWRYSDALGLMQQLGAGSAS